MSIIKNREQLVDEMTDKLINFAIMSNDYKTDVYAYFNEETKEVTLETSNGNNELNTDHSVIIHTDLPDGHDIFDLYNDKDALLFDATNKDKEKSEEIKTKIAKEIAEAKNINIEDVSVDFLDVMHYIKDNDELLGNLKKLVSEWINESRSKYAEYAEDIISQYEEKLKEEHQIDAADISSPDNLCIIKNREQVVDELTDMLVNFEKELNAYDTDVYAYFNTETKEVTLDTFVNPGGNSWLNDNSDTIYTDKQHNNSIFDSYDNEGDLLAAATNENKEKSEAIMNEIKKQIAEDEDIDIEDVSVSYFDIRDYIENNDELMENLSNAYSDLIDEMRPEYAEQAENIVDKYEEKLKEEHQIDTADISSPEKLCEIGFLNNGSAVMKLTYDDVEYVHNYDDMAQMARDYKDFMESPDTLSDWTEGNEPELWDDIYNDIAYLPYNSETDDISELNTDWGGNVSEFVSIINEANNDKSLSPDKEVENEPLFSKKKIMSDEFKPKSEKGKEDRSKSKNHNMEM